MNSLNSNFVTMYRLGYLEADVPSSVMQSLRSETEEMENTNFKDCISYNNRLDGNIEREYRIIKAIPVLDDYIAKLTPAYYDNYGGSEGMRFKLANISDLQDAKDVWVNFQKKYEYNPIHRHSGDLSFVVYVKIPYLLEDEYKNLNTLNSNKKTAGMFSFVHSDQYAMGGVTTYPLPTDRNFEGKIIIFSSSLCHTVYPFYTSDDYRVSVAGNIMRY